MLGQEDIEKLKPFYQSFIAFANHFGNDVAQKFWEIYRSTLDKESQEGLLINMDNLPLELHLSENSKLGDYLKLHLYWNPVKDSNNRNQLAIQIVSEYAQNIVNSENPNATDLFILSNLNLLDAFSGAINALNTQRSIKYFSQTFSNDPSEAQAQIEQQFNTQKIALGELQYHLNIINEYIDGKRSTLKNDDDEKLKQFKNNQQFKKDSEKLLEILNGLVIHPPTQTEANVNISTPSNFPFPPSKKELFISKIMALIKKRKEKRILRKEIKDNIQAEINNIRDDLKNFKTYLDEENISEIDTNKISAQIAIHEKRLNEITQTSSASLYTQANVALYAISQLNKKIDDIKQTQETTPDKSHRSIRKRILTFLLNKIQFSKENAKSPSNPPQAQKTKKNPL